MFPFAFICSFFLLNQVEEEKNPPFYFLFNYAFSFILVSILSLSFYLFFVSFENQTKC